VLGARIITGAILGIAIVATLLFLPTRAVAAIFGLLWLIGAWEWAGFARLGGLRRSAYVALLAVCLGTGWLWLDVVVGPTLFVVTVAWWALALVAVVTFPRAFGMPLVAALGLPVLLPSWWLLVTLHSEAQGPELGLTLMSIVWAADVGAYAFGRWLGRVKLAPAVSPGKTWEGVTGGILAAAVAAVVAARLLGLPVAGFVAVGIATALVSVLGDLTESLFKRNVGLKDSGALFPGHGGVLDRFDSFMAAIPIYVIGLIWLGVIG
jgi:phosphatidate cytidylyltransferase